MRKRQLHADHWHYPIRICHVPGKLHRRSPEAYSGGDMVFKLLTSAEGHRIYDYTMMFSNL